MTYTLEQGGGMMAEQSDSAAPYDDSPIPSAWQRRIERLERAVGLSDHGDQRNIEPCATLTVEIHKLAYDPRSPRWKYAARFTDGLSGPLGVGRGETFAEAIRGAAHQLEPRVHERRL